MVRLSIRQEIPIRHWFKGCEVDKVLSELRKKISLLEIGRGKGSRCSPWGRPLRPGQHHEWSEEVDCFGQTATDHGTPSWNPRGEDGV